MATRPRCPICGRWFRPDVRSVGHQKYCSPRCSKKAKRRRDREHKKRYRDTGLGAEQRRRESTKRRNKADWARYMRAWREADPERRAKQARQQARQYYEKHRAQLLRKRRAQRDVPQKQDSGPTEVDIGHVLVMGQQAWTGFED